VIGNARVVILAKPRMARGNSSSEAPHLEFLVEEMGFTVLRDRSNMPKPGLVNDYVLMAAGDPAAALAGLYFWTWNTEEVLEMTALDARYNQNPLHAKEGPVLRIRQHSRAWPVPVDAQLLTQRRPEAPLGWRAGSRLDEPIRQWTDGPSDRRNSFRT